MDKHSTRRITVPPTIREATDRLTDVNRLVTATEWERAAIVFAFVTKQQGRRTSGTSTGSGDSIADFANRGIVGLQTDKTVRLYYDRWQTAIDAEKAQPVKPGETVTLPDMPWPPTGHSRGDSDKVWTTEGKVELTNKFLSDPEIVQHLDARATEAVIERAADDLPDAVVRHAGKAMDNQARNRRGDWEFKPEINVPPPTAGNECDHSITVILNELRSLRALKPRLSPEQRSEAVGALEELHNTIGLLVTYFRTDDESIDAELSKFFAEERGEN